MVLADEQNLSRVLTNRKITKKSVSKVCLATLLVFTVVYSYFLSHQPEGISATFSSWNIKKLLPSSLVQSYQDQNLSPREKRIILLWTPLFSVKENWLPSTEDLLCPVKNCDITSDRNKFNESSAVILHWRSINHLDLPLCQSGNKSFPLECPLLILYNNESPPHTYANTIEKIKDKIHWTISYRRDSDIVSPYGKIAVLKDFSKAPEIKLNRKGVCWLVSNCNTASRREEYVAELTQYIDVKIFGKCYNRSCPYSKTFDCYSWLSDQCRFYLAFENSICKEYVTEKLYNAMATDMVPVVLGGYDYKTYLPEHSFIDVKNFSSPEALAKYLLELNNDDHKYLAYFEWKSKYSVKVRGYGWVCDLCEKLHRTNLNDVKPYQDFLSWWYKNTCTETIKP